jgi:ribonuclease HII
MLRFEADLWNRGVERVAGVDEAGRGSLAGPVVAAAVIFHPGASIPDVDDSKKLSPARREMLFPLIFQKADVGIGVVHSEAIDEINILQATLLAMRQALDQLYTQPEHVLVDGNTRVPTDLPQTTIVKGDSLSASIAAASIVAKVTRDRMMVDYERTFPGYGFARHKGYGTLIHREAIRRLGSSAIHRKSFKVRL